MSKRAQRYSKGHSKQERPHISDKKESFQSEVKPPITPKNRIQYQLLQSIRTMKCTVFSSPAGTGKSFVTMSEIADQLKRGDIDSIVLSRPEIGMGKGLGFLKGDLREKYEPYLLPLVDVFTSRYGHSYYEECLHHGKITFAPLEYIRGRSFNGVVILDESQNTDPDTMYTVLTRMGEEGTLVILGDPTQTDIKGMNGIQWIEQFVQQHPELKEEINVIKGSSDDIVRSGLCKKLVKAKESFKHD